MKIAVCLSAHVRLIETCFPTLQKALGPNHQFDFFLHTWDKVCSRTPGNSWPIDERKIRDLVKPVQMVVQPQGWLPWLPGAVDMKHLMFWKIWAADLLRRQHGHYDWVVRARPDSFFRNTVPWDEMKPKHINVASPPGGADHGGICDQFWIAQEDEMQALCDRFTKFVDVGSNTCERALKEKMKGFDVSRFGLDWTTTYPEKSSSQNAPWT